MIISSLSIMTGCYQLVIIIVVWYGEAPLSILGLDAAAGRGQSGVGCLSPKWPIESKHEPTMINRSRVIISSIFVCVQGRGPRRSLMSTWFSARAPAIHFASTVGKPRDQPRLHRCNPRTSTTRSAFAAVSGHGGARIVAVSSSPSDPSDGRGDAPKANPPRRDEPRRTSTASMGHVERLISSPDACEMMPHHGACEVDRRHPVWRPR